MRLADFIAANSEPILAEWVAFAATCGPAAQTMDLAGLRDHAQAMLNNIVTDLGTPQSDAEQADKSKGNGGPSHEGLDTADTAAEVHGAGRAESGFTVGEMVSEYRALRASVIRLWTKANGSLTGADLDDLMRFNEAIDQALAESIARYTQDLDQSKEMFLAILGHDLRTPLGAVITSSQFMLDTGELKEPHLTLTTRILRSSTRMNRMVGDLLDFTRSRLGSGVPIVRQAMNMATVTRHAVEEVSAANPESVLDITTSGDLQGEWDAARISQVLANLLSNAVQHGAAKTRISVSALGADREVTLRVHNEGPPIPTTDLEGLFSPLKRLGGVATARSAHNLGLGLYIAERIVTAHGGTIDVSSSGEAGTSFTVRLPR
jgi:signal transduction histidine kinase